MLKLLKLLEAKEVMSSLDQWAGAGTAGPEDRGWETPYIAACYCDNC